ncbi:porin [Propionivibrio sp.]|uniref:porin n=1 Tax=Propionivibrio sp. TaxID=2212460 RepID=UPI0039E3BBEA
MQKKIIALAVAGLVSGVAFAQTNVTVYGLIDQAYVYSKSDNGLTGANSGDYKYSGLKDGGLNGSRIGFKGEEALGNGLKAIFTFEIGKDADNESSTVNFTNRQSFVGLNGNFGTFTAGRQYNAAALFYAKNNSNDVTGVMPVNSLQGQNLSQIRSGGGTARQENVLKYVSPNWSGFTVGASYSFGEHPQTVNTLNSNNASIYDKRVDVTDNGRYSVAADYSNGPFNISAAYAVVDGARGTTTYSAAEGKDVKEWFVGAGFDFKVVKLYATYQDLKNDNDTLTTVTDQKLWSVGLSAPVSTMGKAYLEYAKLDTDTDNGFNNNANARFDGASKGWGVGYEHYLSKRTTLYTQFSQIKHDNDVASTGTWVSGAAARGEKQTNFMAGLRHTF